MMNKPFFLILGFLFIALISSQASAFTPGDFQYIQRAEDGTETFNEYRFYPDYTGVYIFNNDAQNGVKFIWNHNDDGNVSIVVRSKKGLEVAEVRVISDENIKINDLVLARLEYQDHENFEDEPEDYDEVLPPVGGVMEPDFKLGKFVTYYGENRPGIIASTMIFNEDGTGTQKTITWYGKGAEEPTRGPNGEPANAVFTWNFSGIHEITVSVDGRTVNCRIMDDDRFKVDDQPFVREDSRWHSNIIASGGGVGEWFSRAKDESPIKTHINASWDGDGIKVYVLDIVPIRHNVILNNISFKGCSGYPKEKLPILMKKDFSYRVMTDCAIRRGGVEYTGTTNQGNFKGYLDYQ